MKGYVFQVSELNEYVRILLGQDPNLSHMWVEGEISNFKRHSSGHLYFSLKDSAAQVKCAMFKQNAWTLDFKPRDGMAVRAFGSVGLYPRDGQFQLYVEAMQPAGVGNLYEAFERLKGKLDKEGLFDADHKKPLPYLPRKVGVVTSPTGAAVRDIIRVLHRRFDNMDIVLKPVKVQGSGAAEEIARAIEELNGCPGVDVIIVGRGGGSIEDLWAFNEEVVARSIYASQVPVISAVGHETDYTIADFVADVRAATPSMAAELAAPVKDELMAGLMESRQRLRSAMGRRLDLMRERLERLKQSTGLTRPLDKVWMHRQQVDGLVRMLQAHQSARSFKAKNDWEKLHGRLLALGPESVLKRGYAMVLDLEGRPVMRAADAAAGNTVEVRWQDGARKARIEPMGEE
ncbi:exodeoxyribonuclease VII large subunit [Gehongia tenuis]|uniref:Exodeoxyribonuclease 7 large subunit n=1 Tax=Gehongia tenuis TaxID=2763655 RepID=A0A926HPF8_9FIRM|nr:exodeoxyribonuclease VII large subunit [Gehongia tenuis]MBC8531168.1 exodeoxyribonuclease VII large subunit [Gehongia tenuis]